MVPLFHLYGGYIYQVIIMSFKTILSTITGSNPIKIRAGFPNTETKTITMNNIVYTLTSKSNWHI